MSDDKIGNKTGSEGLSETDKARAEKLLPVRVPEECYMPQ